MANSVLLAQSGQRILFVLAHPDDAEFLVGGTVAYLAQEGKDLHYLLVTRGDKGSEDPEMTPERMAQIREQEQRDAAREHGIQTVTFLEGYYDGEVEPSIQLRKDIALVIRQWKPDTIFTFDPWKKSELHPDHRAVGIVTVDAIACARGRMYYPEQLQNGITPHRVKDIYYFNTDRPNHWIDIGGVLEKKVAGLRCHKSQMINFDPEAWVRRRGMHASGGEHKIVYAEVLHHDVI